MKKKFILLSVFFILLSSLVNAAEKPVVFVVSTGGTIASVNTEEGYKPGIMADELVKMVPEIRKHADLKSKELFSLDSTNFCPADWVTLAEEIEEICQQNPDGIVITHGTDTMAYTASMLSFMIENPPCPIILTGSQIPMAEKGSDGPDNLLNSVQFAAYGPTGIYIVFNGKIIHGVNSSKFYTSRKNAFVSVNRKPAGRFLPYSDISTNSVKVKKIDWPGRKKGNSVFNTRISDRVLMVRITPGFKPQWLEEFCNPDEVDGIILLGYGLGGVPNREPLNLLPVIEKFIDKQIPVVVLSQCPYEAPDLKVYEVGLKALKMGVIPGGKMTKEAALTKLMWVLGQTRDMKRIKQMMTENLRGEL